MPAGTYSVSTSAQTIVGVETYDAVNGATYFTGQVFSGQQQPMQPTINQPQASGQAPNPQPQGTVVNGKVALAPGRPTTIWQRVGRWRIPLWAMIVLLTVAVFAICCLIYSLLRRSRRREA
jgi:hypothetical protein